MVLAQRSACEILKHQLRAKGLKVQHFKHREIVVMAKEYFAKHPELIAEAKPVVERWQADGVFGPRGLVACRFASDDREPKGVRR